MGLPSRIFKVQVLVVREYRGIYIKNEFIFQKFRAKKMSSEEYYEHPDRIGYCDGKKTYLTKTPAYSSDWGKAKRRAETTCAYRGTPDGSGGNYVYETKTDGVIVRSGHMPYSSYWFKDAKAQGVERYISVNEW